MFRILKAVRAFPNENSKPSLTLCYSIDISNYSALWMIVFMEEEFMSALLHKQQGVYWMRPGAGIGEAIEEARQLSCQREHTVSFQCCGIHVNVQSDSEPELLYRDIARALDGCIHPSIGPHPAPSIPDSDARRNNQRPLPESSE